MTHQTIAEKYVRDKCPELMELSFGCEVKQSKTGAIGFLVGTPENENGFGYWFNHDGTIYPLLEEHIEIIGHRIQLQHWLRCLAKDIDNESSLHLGAVHIAGISLYVQPDPEEDFFKFNLTTGQPATEADYAAFNQIVGITK